MNKYSLPSKAAIKDNSLHMNRCDWADCTLEVGLFDGAPSSLLNREAFENISFGNKTRFISLCPQHLELGLTNRTPPKRESLQRILLG